MFSKYLWYLVGPSNRSRGFTVHTAGVSRSGEIMKYMTNGFILSVLYLALIVSGCNEGEKENTKEHENNESYDVTISQGVWGVVKYWEGDHMPRVAGASNSSGSITPVTRTIRIYKSTTLQENEPTNASDVFYEIINSELIAIVYSDQRGFYEAELPIGKYSVFTEEDEGLYANGTDSEFVINPVTIETDTVSRLNINITYSATF